MNKQEILDKFWSNPVMAFYKQTFFEEQIEMVNKTVLEIANLDN